MGARSVADWAPNSYRRSTCFSSRTSADLLESLYMATALKRPRQGHFVLSTGTSPGVIHRYNGVRLLSTHFRVTTQRL